MPIAERQDLLEVLYAQLGGEKGSAIGAQPDGPQIISDGELVAKAKAARNGTKFADLYGGNWQIHCGTQSEADFALIDIIAFYSDNIAQIARVYRGSALGQREKANRVDYVSEMIVKARVPLASLGVLQPPEAAHKPIWSAPAPISYQEFYLASAAPQAIVVNLYYADVGTMIAPGGTGKTTLMLWQAVHIVLGLLLWGLMVVKPGPVVVLTAEDSREMLVARLRSICNDLRLSQEQIQIVAENVLISDVSGTGLKLTEIDRDVVRPSHNVIDSIVAELRAIKPVLVVVDPAISFGVGESRVNDAEQGLIEAGRRIRRELNCCIIYVHHTGKENGRNKTTDQYSGRGGSAFADGSRMVHVLQPLTPSEWFAATGVEIEPGENGLTLVRAKMSYSPPQAPLYIFRKGFEFKHVEPKAKAKEDQLEHNANLVWQYLVSELAQNRWHTQTTLEQAGLGLVRTSLRAALSRLEAGGRTEIRDRPIKSQGGAHKYIHPLATLSDNGGPNPIEICTAENLDPPPPIGIAPLAAGQNPNSYATPKINGGPTAGLAGQGSGQPPPPENDKGDAPMT